MNRILPGPKKPYFHSFPLKVSIYVDDRKQYHRTILRLASILVKTEMKSKVKKKR